MYILHIKETGDKETGDGSPRRQGTVLCLLSETLDNTEKFKGDREPSPVSLIIDLGYRIIYKNKKMEVE